MAKEPELREVTETFTFPPEPTFSEEHTDSGDIPRIVPAETEAIPSIDSAQSLAREAARRQMRAQVSRDFENVSAPIQINEPGNLHDAAVHVVSDHGDYAGYDDDDEESSSPSILRSIVLTICLAVVLVSAWQLTILLQPDFLSNNLLRKFSEKSCNYIYCPPVRPMTIRSSQMSAVDDGKWKVTLQLQNFDMRSQSLPAVELTLENTDKTVVQKIFKPSDYVVASGEKSIRGGSAEQIDIIFDYTEKRPANFSVKLANESN